MFRSFLSSVAALAVFDQQSFATGSIIKLQAADTLEALAWDFGNLKMEEKRLMQSYPDFQYSLISYFKSSDPISVELEGLLNGAKAKFEEMTND